MTDIKHYDVIMNPVVTEKSTFLSENNVVTFNVPMTATKPEIKAAVEGLFSVTVKQNDLKVLWVVVLIRKKQW